MHTKVIAEAGVNHNGNKEMAHELVEAAFDAGADIVKFQLFSAENLVTRSAKKAAYQLQQTAGQENYGQDTQFEMLKSLQLPMSAYQELQSHAEQLGIEFLCTAFDRDSLNTLDQQLQLKKYKIPSGEITNLPLLLQFARCAKPLILSTGMANLGEIETALSVLAFGYTEAQGHPDSDSLSRTWLSEEGQMLLKQNVILLHCTTQYPAPLEQVNLAAMKTMQEAFGLETGYSDHTAGINVSIAAAAMGASVIEKHFTLDRDLPGPDHKASLEPQQLAQMVSGIKEVNLATGKPIKSIQEAEINNRGIVRKSIVASRPIKKGEILTEDNMTMKRPEGGRAPSNFWSLLGGVASQDYDTDDFV